MSALGGDLRLLMGEGDLIQLALEATTTVGSQLPPWRSLPHQSVSPQMLLTLFTYSYAAGRYSSEDVEWACQADPATRYICGHAVVELDTLKAFRRGNRPWIEAALARVLERANEMKQLAGGESGWGQLSEGQGRDAAWLDLARRRLELAMLMDMAMAD